jgi:hypothetical protein
VFNQAIVAVQNHPRRTRISATVLRPKFAPEPRPGPQIKKRALRLVQTYINPFGISTSLEKFRRKNEQKQPKIALFWPSYRQIARSLLEMSMQGMGQVWARYD